MTTVLKTASDSHHSHEVSRGLPGVAALRFLAMRCFVQHRFALVLALLPLACAGSPEATPKAKVPSQIDVPRTVITADSATSLPEMFAEAQAKARSGDLAGAARLFDRI